MINSTSLWKVEINLLMLLFPPPYICCKWKNTISKPNPAENVSNLQNTTSLYNMDDFFILERRAPFIKRCKHLGLSLILVSSRYLFPASLSGSYQEPGWIPTAWRLQKQTTSNKQTDKTFDNHPSLNCGSFLILFYSSPGTSYMLLCVNNYLMISYVLSSQWYHRLLRTIT